MGWLTDWWRGVPVSPKVYGPEGYSVVGKNDKGSSRPAKAQQISALTNLDGIFVVDVSGRRRRATAFDISWRGSFIMFVNMHPSDLSISIPARVLLAVEDDVNPAMTTSGSLQTDTTEDTSS